MKPTNLLRTIAILMCLLITSKVIMGQTTQDSVSYYIETVDGNSFTGTIAGQDAEKIMLKTEKLGVITLRRADIRKMTVIELAKFKDGKYWFDNPQATRYFFSPNGYGLKRGEGYYQNTWVLFNSVAVGMTDNFSIGAGLVPLFLFGGTSTPAWLTPKISFPVKKDKVQIGAGALIGAVIGEENTGFGILYGLTTFGSRDNNLTLGIGYGYAGGELANSPMFNINGMFRTGARGYFLTENYIFSGGGSTTLFLSFGGRQIIKNAGLDYGLWLPVGADIDAFVAIPWLGLTIPIGKK